MEPRANRIASHLGWIPLFAVAIFFAAASSDGAEEHGQKTVAFLTVDFQNDNDMYEPTSDAERTRLAAIGERFQERLQESGRYTFVNVPPNIRKRIDRDQAMGDCGGCEIDYGRELGGDLVAWINVQKVSNLILNMNVYMADVGSERMRFVHSVDIRGNDDESWSRSLDYLISNYLLETPS